MDTQSEQEKKIRAWPLVTYPAEYRILVQGILDMSWSERLAGMTLTTIGGKDVPPLTTLQGKVADQSALVGVLNTLHDLNFVLLSVEFVSQA